MKTYEVTATLKYPSCYNSGYVFEVHAATKADAVKRARVEASYAGHTKMDGALIYRAVEMEG